MSNSQLADDGSWPAGPLKSSLKIRVQPAGTGPARRGAAIGGNRWSREGIPHGHPGSPACSSRKLRPPMNQARNDDGSYDDGWYHDDQQLPPSLGVWPLGRTYVHSSDGALNTGPAVAGDPGANGHGGAERSFDGDHIAAPRFSGAAGDGSTPLYERLALYERLSASPPADPGPSRNDRPPLYQVGGKYRGDDWPTDPGFRGAGPDLAYAQPRHDPRFGGPDPGYAQPRRDPSFGGPEQDKWQQRDPQPVTRIRPDTPAVQGQGRQGGETWERNVTPAARVAAVEDARLLACLHDLIRRLKAVPSLYPRVVFLIVGYAAVTSLAAAYAEAIPLLITASLIVIPAAGVIFNLGMRYPDWGRRALVGWLAGMVATIVYDVLRLSLVKAGIWGDPIPGIGRLVFADPHANFAWGYLWRFAGNGGGMGIAYTMLPWRGVRTGVAYGTLICTGLVALLFCFPVAQVHFFPLTPVTTAGAYAGHWVYGAVLGKITSWWLPPVELGRIHGRLTARLIHPGHRPRPAHARSAGAAGDPRGARLGPGAR